MRLSVLSRRSLALAFALLAGAAVAWAGGGTSFEEGTHTRTPHASPASSVSAPTPAPTPAHLSPTDDPPLTAPRAPQASRVERATPSRSALPATPAPDRHSEKRERGRTPNSATLRVHRPVTQRSKGAVRSMPATPGMGGLLRIGAGQGRELSFRMLDANSAPSTLLAGRAPPRGPTSFETSRASAFVPPDSPACVPSAAPPDPQTPTNASTACVRTAVAFACPPASTPGVPGNDSALLERNSRSRADRLKGAIACTNTPFGGFHP